MWVWATEYPGQSLCSLSSPERDFSRRISDTLKKIQSMCSEPEPHQSSLLYHLHVLCTALVCCCVSMQSSLHGQLMVSTMGCLHMVSHSSVWSLSCLRVQEKPLMPTSCRSPVPSLGFALLFYPAVPETFRSFQPLNCSWTRSCFMVVTDEILLKLGIWQSHCFSNHTLA